MPVNIVRSEFSQQATIFEPVSPPSGRLKRLVWRVKVYFGWEQTQRPVSLFQRNMGAWRFVTDDGRSAHCPITMELVHNSDDRGKWLAAGLAMAQLDGVSSHSEGSDEAQ